MACCPSLCRADTGRSAAVAYGALGTGRYLPFTLADDPGYPAQLEVQYPDQLSRGLVLVEWWLLAIPHLLIIGAFSTGSYVVGGVTPPASRGTSRCLGC
jgi:hypothetical protein